MNKARRKQLSDLSTETAAVVAVIEENEENRDWEVVRSTIGDLHTMCESIRDDEQEYYDNMPEGLKNSDKGENAQSAISCLEEAAQKLEGAESACEDTPDAEDVIEHLNDAIEQIDEAQGF